MLASIRKEILSYLLKIQISADAKVPIKRGSTPPQVAYDHKTFGQFDVLSSKKEETQTATLNTKEAQPELQTVENTTYVRTQDKVGRNQPCPCGSGKKYKRCCGKDV
ncbi:SEC-C domain-containing protein [bacterium]|nr:SEC-C domain-containing protein [bacterium]